MSAMGTPDFNWPVRLSKKKLKEISPKHFGEQKTKLIATRQRLKIWFKI